MNNLTVNSIEKAKLKTQYANQIHLWQTGSVEFDSDSFIVATQLLKAHLLPNNAISYFANQVHLAMEEALHNKTPLAAFYQKPHTQPSQNMNTENLAEAVQHLITEGFSKQEAIQKVSIRFKTSAFNVNKQYRTQFENKH